MRDIHTIVLSPSLLTLLAQHMSHDDMFALRATCNIWRTHVDALQHVAFPNIHLPGRYADTSICPLYPMYTPSSIMQID
jgi:hypothetical protein